MPRFSRCRSFICEVTTVPFVEKISLVLPILVLVIDIILIEHAIRINEHYIIFFTSVLFSLSVIEMVLVIREIHTNYNKNNLLKTLTIKVSDYMCNKKGRNVKILVSGFLSRHPEYLPYRDEIYRIFLRSTNRTKNDMRKKNSYFIEDFGVHQRDRHKSGVIK